MDAIQFHSTLAPDWSAKYERPSFRRRADALLALPGVDVWRDKKWLDAGCGTGDLSRQLAARGASVVGVDGSREMVSEAERRCSVSGIGGCRFEWIETVERLPFQDGEFDHAICSSVIEYLESPHACLRELHRVIRPGGLLVISAPNRLGVVRRLQKAVRRGVKVVTDRDIIPYLEFSRNDYSMNDLTTSLSMCGFSPERQRYFDGLIPATACMPASLGSLLMIAARCRDELSLVAA